MDKRFTDPKFLDYTIEVFQPYFPHPLSREQAREIAGAMVHFSQALLELESTFSSQKTANNNEKDPDLATFAAKPIPFRPH